MPTEDRAAIRSAYAARLKAMDVDDTPLAFVTLRAALDRALGRAAPANVPSGSDDLRPRFLSLAGEVEELAAMLAEGDPEAPPAAEAVEAQWRRVVEHPDADRLDQAEWLERNIARLVLNAGLRSEPLVIPAVEHFGWLRSAKRWDGIEGLEAIVRRYDMVLLRQRVRAMLAALPVVSPQPGPGSGSVLKVLRRNADMMGLIFVVVLACVLVGAVLLALYHPG